MQLNVKDEIKQSADLCKNNFDCLYKQGKELCKVTSLMNDNVMFMRCLCDRNCAYKHHLEERVICTCPVRLELFKKYNI